MKKCILLFIILFLFSGCYNYKELNEMAIVSSIGIDKKDDKYLVTTQVMNSKENEESENSQITIYSTKGNSILEAVRNMTEKSPRKFYGGHLSKIVLSEEVAKESIVDILDIFARVIETRNEFIITVVKDEKASDVLKVLTSTESIPAEYVKDTLKTSDFYNGLTYSMGLDEFLSLYLKKGIDPTVPILKIDKPSKKSDTIDNVTTSDPPTKIVLDGVATTYKGKFEDFLTDDETLGYNYLRNQIQQMVIPVKCDEDHYASIAVQKNKTTSKVKKINEKYQINFNINTKAIIGEYNCAKDLTKEKNIEEIEKKTEKKIRKYIRKAIEKQTVSKGQFLGLERLIYYKYPKNRNYNYKVNYKVNVELIRKGEIRNSVKGAKSNEYKN